MRAETYGIDCAKGVVNRGNLYRIERAMKKAMRGEAVTVGFLGGSITQGCLSSTPETCYAYLVYRWWCERFPEAAVAYVNAGIGGTTSQFGTARADSDLLSKNIDFTVVEFSVNDEDNAHFLETYEGLIRKLYASRTQPGILIVNSVRYDDGSNAQAQHVRIGEAYGLPCVSMKPTLYAKILDGTYTSRDITADDLHPNDEGHGRMAEVIIHFLETVYDELQGGNEAADNHLDVRKITPVTLNAYENSVRYQNYNSGSVLTGNDGFAADDRPQNDIREIFRRGWTADKEGAHIGFDIEGSCFGVQYRKSVAQPTCIARAVVDGDTGSAVILDGNFEETWGDSLHLETVAEHLPYGKHHIEIELTEAHEQDKVPFYLVSVIGSGR
ncbi:MAG: SGNH/GDSL hydrolase family protein [Lachnospiraceae bacterium]|nr:SGNH/GDSL hydrolase family protein [Lachnospiraceae bacterium]